MNRSVNVKYSRKCRGNSMEPTLSDKDVLLIRKNKKCNVQKGDILILRDPLNTRRYLCKRAIFLQEDNVPVKLIPTGRVPVGSMWVEGDNFLHSLDSRHYGPVPKGLILGKAICTVWPNVKFLNGEPL